MVLRVTLTNHRLVAGHGDIDRGRSASPYRYVPCTNEVAVYAHSEKVRQILLNLLSNAVKFTEPDGSIDVPCTVEPDLVRVHVSEVTGTP